jgi:hypothetical protein
MKNQLKIGETSPNARQTTGTKKYAPKKDSNGSSVYREAWGLTLISTMGQKTKVRRTSQNLNTPYQPLPKQASLIFS